MDMGRQDRRFSLWTWAHGEADDDESDVTMFSSAAEYDSSDKMAVFSLTTLTS
jgi:hypothetical protein